MPLAAGVVDERLGHHVLRVLDRMAAKFGQRAVKRLALEGLLRELDHLAVVGRDQASRAEQVGLAQAALGHFFGIVFETEARPDEIEAAAAACPMNVISARPIIYDSKGISFSDGFGDRPRSVLEGEKAYVHPVHHR